MMVMRTSLWILLPLIVFTWLCMPVVFDLLPAYMSYLPESYQPIRALKFYSTFGNSFHKYGPLPNLLLAPVYLPMLAYWYFTGSLTNPSGDFPYGLHYPLQQLSALVFAGRITFLILSLVILAIFMYSCRRLTTNRHLVAFVFCLFAFSNIYLIRFAVNTRPDGPMILFIALALACYCRIVFDRLTMKRAVWMSIFASCAISSKELAGPLFVLPYLALIPFCWWQLKGNSNRKLFLIKSMIASFLAGVITYALLSIIYAPRIWFDRIFHWTGGIGTSSAVWGGGLDSGQLSYAGYFGQIAVAMLDNLGPAGVIVFAFVLLFVLVFRPRHWIMLALPPLSVLFLGVLPIGYVVGRFYMVFFFACIPLLIVFFDQIYQKLSHSSRVIFNVAMLLLVVTNFYWALFLHIQLAGSTQHAIEHDLRAHYGKSTTVNILSLTPGIENKNRIAMLGYHFDPQSIAQIEQTKPNHRPEVIYAPNGLYHFILDAHEFPARAAMFRDEFFLDVQYFQSLEQLGYTRVRTLQPQCPRWFLFDRMPVVQDWLTRQTVYVYARNPNAIREADPS